MKERFSEVPTSAGRMKTFVTHPEQDGPFPAVVIYMDFWGAREELYDIARWLAAVGFFCVVPDLYYRQGIVVNEIHNAQGKMVSLNRLDEATHAKVLEPLKKLTDAEVMDDTVSLLHFLDKESTVRPGPKGCVGFCLGGRLVIHRLHSRTHLLLDLSAVGIGDGCASLIQSITEQCLQVIDVDALARCDCLLDSVGERGTAII